MKKLQNEGNAGTRSKAGGRRSLVLLSAAAVALGGMAVGGSWILGGSSQAWAVVGRPATPVSYAGVARRTSRRTVRRTAAATYPSGTVTALPSGCVRVGGNYRCGSAYYRPYYDGPNLVYVPTTP